MKKANDKIISKEIKIKNQNIAIEDNYCEKELSLKSKAACVYDCNSQRILYGKNINEKLPMASTTKIMTCIIALEKGILEDNCIVSRYAASMPDVQLNAVAGDSFILKDLLYSLMLESHNDVAVVIAENIGAKMLGDKVIIDDIEKSKEYVAIFAKEMNNKVKELGLNKTNFVTPNGLDHKNHYTTAYELACIANYAIKNRTFLDIIGTYNYSIKSEEGRQYIVNNKNQFLQQYSGAIGCKTGYTSKAGYCFVGAIDREQYHLVSVVLGCGWPPNKSYKWQDTKKLMDYGVNNYKSKDIIVDSLVFGNNKTYVDNGYAKICLEPKINEKFRMLLSDEEKVSIKVKLVRNLVAPINKGQVIGYVKTYVGKYENKTIYIKSDINVEKKNLMDMFTELLQIFLNSKVDFEN